MKYLTSLFICLIFFASQCFAAEKAPQQLDATQIKADYFKNPKNNLLVLIERTHDLKERLRTHNLEDILTIHYSAYMNGQTTNKTFKTTTPYAFIIPCNDTISNLKNDYVHLPREKRISYLMTITKLSPMISIIAQGNLRGLEGTIYFNGQKVSSDESNVSCPTISLHHTIPLAEKITQ